MIRRNAGSAAVAACIALAACSRASSEQADDPNAQQVEEQREPADATASEVTAATSDADPAGDADSAQPTAPPDGPSDTVEQAPSPTSGAAPTDAIESDVFGVNESDEFVVAVLLSDSGLGRGQTRPIGFAVGLANREISSQGAPDTFSAPVQFSGDGDLTEDLDKLRGSIDELLDPSVDLFVGAVSPSLVAETTERAAERGIPTVIVNHVDDGSAPQLGIRFDLGGSTDLSYAALVAAVVRDESDGIVIVGPVGDADTELVEQLLIEAGAAPEVIDAPATAPSPGAVIEVREQIAAIGDGPTVILLSQPWVGPLIATMATVQSDPWFVSTDATLTRADVGALGDFGDSTLTVVRRVEDLRRPEQSEFLARVFENQEEGPSTHAAVSYDAYVLAGIAAMSTGLANPESVRSGMIEASRGGEVCTAFVACLTLAASGVDVDYDGVSGPIDLDDDGVATASWFSIDVVDSATGGDVSSEFVLQRR